MDERLLKASCIVFDVGNVLLSFEPEKVAELLPGEHRQALYTAMFGPDWRWAAFDLGAESNDEIAQSMAEAAGVPGGKEMVLYAFRHFYQTMNPLPLYHLLPELKSMGKRLYALTNYGEPAFSFAKEHFPSLQLLEGEVVSSREKIMKPDGKIFRLIAARYQLTPGETLFIDDSLANCQGAEKEGFQTWHYFGDDRIA